MFAISFILPKVACLKINKSKQTIKDLNNIQTKKRGNLISKERCSQWLRIQNVFSILSFVNSFSAPKDIYLKPAMSQVKC